MRLDNRCSKVEVINMIILRNKLFGKFDKRLAELQGKSIGDIRAERAGYKATGTVNDLINLRGDANAAGNTGAVGIAKPKSILNGKARALGYSNYNVRAVNNQLKENSRELDMAYQKQVAEQNARYLQDFRKDTKLKYNSQNNPKNPVTTQAPKNPKVGKGQMGRGMGKFIKKNKAALITTGLGTAGYLGYRHLKNK